MKNIKAKTALSILLGISALFFFLILTIKGVEDITLIAVVKVIPQVVTLDVLIVAVFSSFLWRWRVFKDWLVPFPDLNGTWKGEIHSTWTDPETGNRPPPIPTILTIKQSFFNISCVMRTGEMVSRSLVGQFLLDKENQMRQLVYTYNSNPSQSVKDRSPQHFGTMVFDISEKPDKTLVGEYWTGRKTTGQVKLTFWKEERVDTYTAEIGEHPVSRTRGNKS